MTPKPRWLKELMAPKPKAWLLSLTKVDRNKVFEDISELALRIKIANPALRMQDCYAAAAEALWYIAWVDEHLLEEFEEELQL